MAVSLSEKAEITCHVFTKRSTSAGAQDYRALAQEVMEQEVMLGVKKKREQGLLDQQ
jgi:hypothetical protein